MDGPRTLLPDERASLMHLVDDVFVPGEPGLMFRAFPQFFDAGNDLNHWVFVENGEVVAHAGMMTHDARIAGCAVRVGCVGAVASRESHRGQGLASRLMDLLCKSALERDMDFLLISGDRGLYRRMDAVPFAHEYTVTINAQAAAHAQHLPVRLVEADEQSLPAWEQAYAEKPAHFVRTREDWHAQMCARTGGMWTARFFSMHVGASCHGYIVAAKPNAEGQTDIIEFAGHPPAVQSAMAPLLQCVKAKTVRLRLQQTDGALLNNLRVAGANIAPGTTEGVLRLVRFAPFMDRLRPFIEKRVGHEAAEELRFEEKEGRCVFSDPANTFSLTPAEAAQVIFGGPEKRALPGIWNRIFPLPLLAYGINYV